MTTFIIIHCILLFTIMSAIIFFEGMIIGDLYVKPFEEYIDKTFIDVPPWVVRRARVRLSWFLRVLYVALFFINILVIILI